MTTDSATTFNKKWNRLAAASTIWVSDLILLNKSTIWFSTNFDKGDKGMTAYDCKSNEFSQTIKYPSKIIPKFHTCCCYDDNNEIYIVDSYNGENGQIISFNPSNGSFTKKINIPRFGKVASCIAVNDNIHILFGSENTKQQYIIYSMKDNTIKQHEISNKTMSKLCNVNLLKYKERLIAISGWNLDDNTASNSFYISSKISKSDTNKNEITWTLQPKWKLPQQISGCGCILYNKYIITFGGVISITKAIDTIYVLNLSRDESYWEKILHIKCPIEGNYKAILDGDNNVHLVTAINEDDIRGHYSIQVKDILERGEILTNGYMKMCIFEEKIVDKQLYDISINSIIIDYVGVGV